MEIPDTSKYAEKIAYFEIAAQNIFYPAEALRFFFCELCGSARDKFC
jgi:hypothetical protein